MAFSSYQSLGTVPSELDEVSRHFWLPPGCDSARRGAVAMPADLEHDDVDVGRRLRGRIRGDHGRGGRGEGCWVSADTWRSPSTNEGSSGGRRPSSPWAL